MMRNFVRAAAVVMTAALWPAMAQEYPAQTIRIVSPFPITRAFCGVGSKCGSAGWSLTPTIGHSRWQVSPLSSKRRTMNCWTSNSVTSRPDASASRISAKASSLIAWTRVPASRWLR